MNFCWKETITIKQKAFTLIELLVVIAIIAVLMSILMPSLRLAREQARSIHCLSNIRTLTMAWSLYKDENDSKLVSGHTPGPSSNNPGWVIIPPNGGDSTIEQKKKYLMEGLLWPYVKEVEAYRCPSDRRDRSTYHKNAYRTYSIAGGMNGVSPSSAWEIKPCLTFSDIKGPATKYVFLAECEPRGYNMGSWVMRPKSRRWVDPFAIWHSKDRSTLGWADGHADMQRWYSQGLIEWNMQALHTPQNFSFNRTPEPGDEQKDFEFALKGYAYKALE